MPNIFLYPGLSPDKDVKLTDPTTLNAPPASVTINSTLALPFNGLGSWLTEDLGQEWLTEITGEAWLVEVNHLAEFANVVDATVTASAEAGTSGALAETIPSTVTATAETATAGSLAETLTSTVTASAETGSASVAAETLATSVTASAETASAAVAVESLAVSIEASAETGSDSLADAVEIPPEPEPDDEDIGIGARNWPATPSAPKKKKRGQADYWSRLSYDIFLPPDPVRVPGPTPIKVPEPVTMAGQVGKPGAMPPVRVPRETPRRLPPSLEAVESGMAGLVDRMLSAQDVWEAMQRQRAAERNAAAMAESDDEEALMLLM